VGDVQPPTIVMSYLFKALLPGALLALAGPVFAQWNPAAGQWGKVDPADLRVMTYNVQDGLCSTNAKVEGNNNWCALARIVAALRPDVLVLMECADNTGNGTGSGVDSVATMTTVLNQFLHGGNDTFNGNTPITSWVQHYAAGYDLPYSFVSSETDSFNRNCILSRYPFADLNGDTKATISDIPTVTASAWAPGGDGGIRGFAFAEINLPDATYLGNMVMGFAHLKAGGATSDHDQRIAAAENVSYVVRYWYNGNGGALPDPLAKIADSPAATTVLDALTPVVMGGDWNEDEAANGATRGPADWLTAAQTVGGSSDGTDRNGTDMTLDSATHFSTGSDASHNSGSKFDYVAWQDSIATMRLQTIFISGSNPAAAQPPELAGFAGGAAAVTNAASDHRPVLVDLRLPIVDCNGNAVADTSEIAANPSLDLNANQILDACESTGVLFCYGTSLDGTHTTQCPCGNDGVIPNGCAHSSNPAGAHIQASGISYLDTVVLAGSGMPSTAFGLYMQHDGTGDQVFHDGVLCAGGTLIRLRGRTSVGGASTFPDSTDTVTLSQRGQVTPGDGVRRYYAVWFRNASTTFCPPATANVTNGLYIDW
jgi:endonuclease/exonuclease/phosphatase family metal-dependent hydrolase